MAGTQVKQIRSTLVLESSNKYEIYADCLVAGTLPDTGIFLLNIIQPTDPKNDTLARVAQIGDFSNYLTSRTAAINAGATQWRSTTLTLQYDNIDEADAAWKELSSRINALVLTVDNYDTSFTTPIGGEITSYPAADESTKNAYISAYVTARDAVDTAVDARDEHLGNCNTLSTELQVIEERRAEAVADHASASATYAPLVALQATLPPLSAGLAQDVAAGRAANNASSATDGEVALIEAEFRDMDARLVTFDAQNSAFWTALLPLAALVSTLSTRVSTLTAAKNAKQTELNQCNATLATLQAAVDSARAVRDSALATILAVCPDFDIQSV